MVLDSCGIFYLTNIKSTIKKEFEGIHYDDPIRRSLHLSIIRLVPLLRISEHIPLEVFNLMYKAIFNESCLTAKLVEPCDAPAKELFNHLIESFKSENPKETLLTRVRLSSNHLVFDE